MLAAANTKKTATISRYGLWRPQQLNQQSKTTIILCGGLLSRPTAARKKHNHPVRRPITAASEGKNHNQTVWFVAASKNNNQPLRPVASRKNTIILCGGLTRPQAGGNPIVRPLAATTKKQQSTFAACHLQGEEKTTINL